MRAEDRIAETASLDVRSVNRYIWAMQEKWDGRVNLGSVRPKSTLHRKQKERAYLCISVGLGAEEDPHLRLRCVQYRAGDDIVGLWVDASKNRKSECRHLKKTMQMR